MNEILIAIVVLAILLLLLVLIFSYLVKNINRMLRKVYVDKLQEYDYLINEKEVKLSNLKHDVTKEEEILDDLKEKVEELRIKEEKQDKKNVLLPSEADYEDENILSGYKKIKKGFNFDRTKVINEFLSKNMSEDTSKYDMYLRIRGYFTHKVLYKISTFSREEQKLIVEKLLQDDEKESVKNLLNTNKFNIELFLKKLDDLIMKNNPIITIYVGDKDENYDNINNRVITKYDSKITDGFRIEYKGNIYDYSI